MPAKGVTIDPNSITPLSDVRIDPASVQPIDDNARSGPADNRNAVQRWFDEETKVEPWNTRPGVMGHALTEFGNFGGGFMGMAAPLVHPIQTAKMAVNSINQGMSPAPNRVFADVPSLQESLVEGLATDPVGTMANAAGGAVAGEGLGMAVHGAFGPRVPLEGAEAARPMERMAARVAPRGEGGLRALPRLHEDLMAEHPAVLRYAKGNGMRVGTAGDYSKAASSLRENEAVPAYSALRDQTVASGQPRVNLSQEAGAFTIPGDLKPIGTIPTFGEVEKALHAANELEGPSYRMGANANDTSARMAAGRHAAEFRTALNNEISTATGEPPEEVSATRARMGKLGNIAENAEQRYWQNKVGRDLLPTGTLRGSLLRGAQSLAGGPEAWENLAFRHALRGTTRPAPVPLHQMAAPLALGAGAASTKRNNGPVTPSGASMWR